MNAVVKKTIWEVIKAAIVALAACLGASGCSCVPLVFV